MKKLLTIFAMFMITLSTTLVQAQTKTTQVVKTTKTHAKKEGTADKQYKEKKASSTSTVVGPTKKDGTADVSYKANKTTVKKSTPKKD